MKKGDIWFIIFMIALVIACVLGIFAIYGAIVGIVNFFVALVLIVFGLST